MSRYSLVYVSLFVAVFLPLLMVAKAQMDFAKSDVIRVDIEPYDPRDLLYGQYMQFKINWNWKNVEEAASVCTDHKNCCLCISDGVDNPFVNVMNCEESEKDLSCKHSIQGKSYGSNQFDAGINRFYVDERFALPLEQVFQSGKEKFRVGLFVRDGQKPILEKLYVGNGSLEEYLVKNNGVLPDAKAPEDLFPTQPQPPQ
jgi:uncharacterized membrane-anchored protein